MYSVVTGWSCDNFDVERYNYVKGNLVKGVTMLSLDVNSDDLLLRKMKI